MQKPWRSDERTGVGVVMFDEALDVTDESLDAGEGTSANAFWVMFDFDA